MTFENRTRDRLGIQDTRGLRSSENNKKLSRLRKIELPLQVVSLFSDSSQNHIGPFIFIIYRIKTHEAALKFNGLKIFFKN